MKLKVGYIDFTLSICLFVQLPICGRNHVCGQNNISNNTRCIYLKYTSYQAASEGVSCVKVFLQNS